ncbi:hypothetical protein M885DRAFT_573575 [Pelagophyceae sp. CCMP2097]|nr:hypothetical protein M885DRAFT_573575 [Pelagophyceae sp. CCMP2097]
MPFQSMVVGACSGMGVMIFARAAANGLRKLFMLRRPWHHLVLSSFCGYIGYYYPIWELEQLAQVNEQLAERKLPPLSMVQWGYVYPDIKLAK